MIIGKTYKSSEICVVIKVKKTYKNNNNNKNNNNKIKICLVMVDEKLEYLKRSAKSEEGDWKTMKCLVIIRFVFN